MRRYTIRLFNQDTRLSVTDVNESRALETVRMFVEQFQYSEAEITPETPRCKKCPLAAYANKLCKAHYHEQGNLKRGCSVHTFAKCKRGHYAKGFCKGHYLKDYRHQ